MMITLNFLHICIVFLLFGVNGKYESFSIIFLFSFIANRVAEHLRESCRLIIITFRAVNTLTFCDRSSSFISWLATRAFQLDIFKITFPNMVFNTGIGEIPRTDAHAAFREKAHQGNQTKHFSPWSNTYLNIIYLVNILFNDKNWYYGQFYDSAYLILIVMRCAELPLRQSCTTKCYRRGSRGQG